MADAAAELEEGGMVRTLKDLFAGAAGGIAQVLLGESQVSALNVVLFSLFKKLFLSMIVT